VVRPRRRWQGAGVSTGDTKIGITGANGHRETETERGEGTVMSKRKICGVVVACALLVAFPLAQEGAQVARTKTTAGAHKVTLNVTHLIASGFQLQRLLKLEALQSVCLATYNVSNSRKTSRPYFVAL
jgi:hypothetical protein